MISICFFILLVYLSYVLYTDQHFELFFNTLKEVLKAPSFWIALPAFIFTITHSLLNKKDNKNKLFSQLVNEYSSKEIFNAIDILSNFAKEKVPEYKSKNGRLKKYFEIVEEDINGYINKYKKLKGKYFKDVYLSRRILANYFTKIHLLIDKKLIDIDLYQVKI